MRAPRVERVISSPEDLALACFKEESGTRSYLALSFLSSPIILSICFWLCWVFVASRAFSAVGSRSHSLVLVCRLLVEVAFLVTEQRLEGAWA